MGLDSATVANAAALTALNPSWSLVVLALIVMVGMVIWMLNKNNLLTKDSNDKSNDLLTTVQQIRSDQIVSNQERKIQTLRLDAIEQVQTKMLKRLDSVEDEIEDIKGK